MPKYIEREALEVALNHRLNFLMAENGEYDHYTSGFDEAVTRVEDFPVADVAPVRHAKVIDKISDDHETIKPWEYRYYCSACKIPMRDSWNKYCPNCGAKMDLED